MQQTQVIVCDDDDFANGDTVTRKDFKQTSLGLFTEADVATDMDSVVQYFEDDDYPNDLGAWE